jgi:hypothetical protein
MSVVSSTFATLQTADRPRVMQLARASALTQVAKKGPIGAKTPAGAQQLKRPEETRVVVKLAEAPRVYSPDKSALAGRLWICAISIPKRGGPGRANRRPSDHSARLYRRPILAHAASKH